MEPLIIAIVFMVVLDAGFMQSITNYLRLK
jgi:hypothetical protein